MKPIRLFAALLMAALVVTSCIKWVEEEGGNSGNNGNSQGGKRVSRILYSRDGSARMAFEYADGKLVHSTDSWDNFMYTYSGKNATIVVKPYSPYVTLEWNLQLNNDGYVESAIAKYQGGTDSQEAVLTFEYSNGYLTKYNYNYSSDYERDQYTYELKYDSNNNLSSLTQINQNKISMIINYTPLNISSKGKTYWILCDNTWLQDWAGGIDLFPFYFAGFLGKEPKNVISTCTINAINTFGSKEYSYSYTYLFDSDNYVKSMIDSGGYVGSIFIYE